MRPWQTVLNLQMQLPSAWPTEPLEQAQLLTVLMKALLSRLAENPCIPAATTLTMGATDARKALAFQAQYAAPLAPSLVQQIETTLQPFLATFRLFTKANCAVLFQTDGFSLKLGWQTSAPPLPTHSSES